MFFSVAPESPIPMYRQLMEQIRFAVASGRLKPDEKLPGVREVAESLGINLQTVVKAYAELVREGTLEARRGMGTFVGAKPKATARADLAAVARLCREAYVSGIRLEELKRLIDETWKKETRL